MEAARTAERLASRNIERRDARGVSLHPKHTRNVDRPRTDRGDYVFRQPILGVTPNRGSSTAGKRDVIRVAPDRFRRRRDAGSAGATTSAVIFFSGCCAGHGDHGFCRRFMGHGDVQVHRPVVHSHCVWRCGVDDSDVTDEHSDAERCARLGACARSSDLHAGVHGCVGGRKCILGLCGGAPRHALFLPGSGDWHSGVTSTDSNFAPAEHSGGAADLGAWDHWRKPMLVDEVQLDQGPVLVTVEYEIEAKDSDEFLAALEEFSRVRRRDGAARWGVYYDTEHPTLYLETFTVESWAEHLRQHDRLTQADRAVEERLHRFEAKPAKVRHFIYARTKGRT